MSSVSPYFHRADLTQNEPKQGEFSDVSSIETSNSKDQTHSKQGTKQS